MFWKRERTSPLFLPCTNAVRRLFLNGSVALARSITVGAFALARSVAVAGSAALAGSIALPSPTRAEPIHLGITRGNNAFAVDLYQSLAKEDGNLFFSPLSVHVSLAMTYAGAAGATAEEIAAVLHLPLAQSDETERPLESRAIADAYAPILERLNAPPEMWMRSSTGEPTTQPAYELTVANALWVQEGLSLKESFLDAVQEGFGSTIEQVDFAQSQAAAARINGWVADETQDRIRNLVSPEALADRTRLVLANAIYFKSGWQSKFHRKSAEAPFFVSEAQTVPVPLMHQTHDFRYFGNDEVQILELPYATGALSMIVLLPREREGLGTLEESLTAESLEDWMNRVESKEVQVWLPRFEFENELVLGETLAALGMQRAFEDRADFSRMTDAKGFFVSKVLHKAFIAVDENGTEAAAATSVEMDLSAMEPEEKPEPKIFRADHPFLFVIRLRETGAVLFLGRVTNPAA